MRKFAAHVVPVTVSTTLVVMAGALMPPLAAWALLLVGPTIALGLALGAWEREARGPCPQLVDTGCDYAAGRSVTVEPRS